MSEPTPPTTDEVRAHWDAFAEQFEARFERFTLPLAHSLATCLHLEEAAAVLEVGAGAGGAARIVQGDLPAGCRHVVTDLAPEMVARARRRLPDAIEVAEADAEALPFEDGAFDRVLANLSLMLVPDPDRALAEARRVLAPGGRAAWSVWGRPEPSLLFTLPPLGAEDAGVELPAKGRSNFHLGDRDALRARVAGHGFADVLAWYTFVPSPFPDGRAMAETVVRTPRWRGLVGELDPERREALAAAIARRADAALAEGRPLGLEALVVTARAG